MNRTSSQQSLHDDLSLVIRFSEASLADLLLTIASPSTTTGLSLKRIIRTHLPVEQSSNRLRLIQAGRVLPDTAAISSVLKPPLAPPPPPRAISSRGFISGKGRETVRDSPTPSGTQTPRSAAQTYIHCSLGDALTPAELAAEAAAAEAAEAALIPESPAADSDVQAGDAGDVAGSSGTQSTAAAPLGFDRLLTAGFTPADVAALRSQYLSILSHTHTPDTLPNGTALRALEDRWLDSSSVEGGSGGGATGSGDEGAGGFTAEDGGLEDMLWGNVMGYFWPIGAVCWLLREEGVWTKRRQIAVATVMIVNLTFGFLRMTS
ncbi:hypothetical protein B0A49_03106 [Cryomyces minteri]|uniref:Ubiquitin-like domain-containing protein n=1 Tax=Cryomyces minteri TaxID=331657 RepID=A0A4U0WLS6_9PEZI|nr:hypothetical protein B0A49_05917 [Cryomyces minteri]TKA69285.1 hypothetical protein B0A49_03106 [Cryomyces minteri]